MEWLVGRVWEYGGLFVLGSLAFWYHSRACVLYIDAAFLRLDRRMHRSAYTRPFCALNGLFVERAIGDSSVVLLLEFSRQNRLAGWKIEALVIVAHAQTSESWEIAQKGESDCLVSVLSIWLGFAEKLVLSAYHARQGLFGTICCSVIWCGVCLECRKGIAEVWCVGMGPGKGCM